MRLLPILLAIAILPGFARAQDDNSSTSDDAIHATTVLHDDGTKTVTITDPSKHSSEASTYNASGKLTEKIVYTLDDQNQVASGIVYTNAGVPVFKASYKHDGLNRVTEEDDYTMADQLIRRFVYEFGADGKVSNIRAFDADGNELQQSDARKDRRQVPPRVH